MKKILKKIIRSPLFFGLSYLALIPIYALIYKYVPDIYNTLTLSDGKTLLSFYESIYFSAVTITTLGYGDISPNGSISQLTSASEAVLGIVTIGLFLNSLSRRSQYNQTKALEERIVALISSILLHHIFVIQNSTLKRIPQPKIRFSVLSEQTIKDNMKGVFYQSKIPSSINTVGISVANSLHKIANSVQALLVHVSFLDPKLIQIISNIENNQAFDSWFSEYKVNPEIKEHGIYNPHTRDISYYSEDFHKLHLMYHELREYFIDNFAYNLSVANSIMSDAIVHNDEYDKGLKFAKQLFNNDAYGKNAYFLAIIAYLKLNKVKKAKWALNKYIDIGPEDSNFVKDQIEKHYSKKITKNEISSIF